MKHISKAPLALACLVTIGLSGLTASAVRADEVTDWNQIMLRAGLAAGTPTFAMIRNSAIVEGAVFDAVNGIERRYTPLHVEPAAPAGASARAAAVQAAYATLVQLFPAQKALFDARRFISLTAIADREAPAAIASGIAWGQTAADGILAWRSTDGSNVVLPPFLGGSGPGVWRPTPPAFAPGLVPQFATATPWVLTSSSQFRPAGPPALTSAQYTADFNEVKALGSASSATRTADQTTIAWFWASSNVNYLWNTVALSLIERGDRDDNSDHETDGHADSQDNASLNRSDARHRHALVDHARLLALVNIAIADGFVAAWDGKYTYVLWRPITAIMLAATDGNPDTTEDPTWTPLIVTPPYPSYASGLTTVSSAAAAVLASAFGDRTRITTRSDLLLGVTRSFRSFSAVLDEIVDARIFAGIHFRFDDTDARTAGTAIGNYIVDHALQPVHDQP